MWRGGGRGWEWRGKGLKFVKRDLILGRFFTISAKGDNFCDLLILFTLNNIFFEQLVDRICPTELQLKNAYSSDIEAPLLDLNLCISNGIVSTKIYDKQDGFDFDTVNFPFLDGAVPRRTSYRVCISQLIRFTTASLSLNDFNRCN